MISARRLWFQRPLYLHPKYSLIREHHERLMRDPHPDEAQRLFDRGIGRGKHVERFQILFLLLFYFSVLGALASHVLIGPFQDLAGPLSLVTSVTAGLSTLFLLGLLACIRYLELLDVELYFFSLEARLGHGPPDAMMSKGVRR